MIQRLLRLTALSLLGLLLAYGNHMKSARRPTLRRAHLACACAHVHCMRNGNHMKHRPTLRRV